MVNSKTFKQLSIAAVALILGMVTVGRQETASAVTFSFQGERPSYNPPQFMEAPTPFAGKFTIDDDFFRTLAENSFELDTFTKPKVAPGFSIFARSASLELTIGDRGTVSATGLELQPFVSQRLPFSGYFLSTRLGDSYFAINVTRSCVNEFKCLGYLTIGLPPVPITFPLVASNIKSVPEQNSAIAISMMGTLMLMLKKKKNITS